MLIALVGLPGVGKSTIGRRLAAHRGVDFVDCDQAIESRLGESIASYFGREGEAAFREVETDVLRALIEPKGSFVLATGGGVVERAANRALLRDNSFCVYLLADAALLLPRLRRSGRRPMFNGADAAARLNELTERRHPLYQEVAHSSVDTTGRSTYGIVERIHDAAQSSGLSAVRA